MTVTTRLSVCDSIIVCIMASGGPELPPKTVKIIHDEATGTISDSTTGQSTIGEITQEMTSQKVIKLP